ncbi:pirin family protein [Polymorphobacter sp. PAMC 29334]|uniref:pirin family protein n=1 Tax=Polymorphobacter sp. PAMC 29334 TaxID=2862331 RepID=UPI001C75933B|nr:pirin family protein [Polymorphobacter sp. PAMC 29334]QYE36379.1 pirin family protein [Polymorphobacter sp. PAMC 29334]
MMVVIALEEHTASAAATPERRVLHTTRGNGHGGIVRLMSPSDLGERLKPFVFLDLFEAAGDAIGAMPVHPHSGIATITVLTEGDVRFDDPDAGRGTIAYGGFEWMRAGGGVWHGQEMSRGTTSRIRGFQLWIALPPELENGSVESFFVEAQRVPQIGPARVILGEYEHVRSPVAAPDGINYLLVTLKAGERWTYSPPRGHSVAFVAVAAGTIDVGSPLRAGDMAVFDKEGVMTFRASTSEAATFVVGSAIAHPHDLVLGRYSVHSSAEALILGEQKIEALRAMRPQIVAAQREQFVPIFKGR